MTASPQFERFRISCFDDSFGATRDGLDVEAALSLSGDERAKAEALIVSSLQQTNDSRPFIAAGVMRIAAASPILRSRLRSGFASRHEYLRVHAARALYQLEKWSEAAATIIDVLENTPKTQDRQWTRMMAVEALGDFTEDSRSQAALFAAVEDEDNFIGFLAIQSLKKVFSQSAAMTALLETLRETQIEPNRWKPGFLQERQLTFLKLESATGIRMPAVAMEKRKPNNGDGPNRPPALQPTLL
jgi:HEAT repeat protein